MKTAFGDKELRAKKNFGSANSINIARLLPQMVYYFEAYRQADNKANVQMIVPSGNFGNLTAGLIAKKMGLPVSKFIAATNANDIVPDYLKAGEYHPRVSRETLSNAMDVGDPSNFVRIKELYNESNESFTWNKIRSEILPHVVSDETTLENIQKIWFEYGYLMDPHTAVAYDATKRYPGNNVIVSTAHWAKFLDTIKRAIGEDIPEIPESLSSLINKDENYISIAPKFDSFKQVIF